MKKRMIVIDGNSLMYRAFYALPPMKNAKGISTNIVYGYVNMLQKIKDELKPDFMSVTFDRKEPTFRHERYEEYKANRMRMPEEMAEQIPYLKKVIQALDYEILEKAGFEADDIIGTLTRHGDEKGFETLVITGDRDALQLISENVNVLLTKKGISEMDRFDFSRLQEEYGLLPAQITDLKGLMGDSSDNIPGVPGVGEKTALELLKSYSTVEELYEHVEEIKKPKLKEKLIANRELAFLSKELATINRQVDITMDYEKHSGNEPDLDLLEDLYQELSLKGFLLKIKKLREESGIERTRPYKQETAPEPTASKPIEGGAPVADSDWVTEAQQALENPVERVSLELDRKIPEYRVSKTPATSPKSEAPSQTLQLDFFSMGESGNGMEEEEDELDGCRMIKERHEMEELLHKLPQDRMIGYKVLQKEDRLFLVVYTGELIGVSLEQGYEAAKLFLEDEVHPKIGFDIKTDLVLCGNRGLKINNIGFDLILGAYIVDPLRNYMKLEYLMEEFIGSSEMAVELEWQEKVLLLLPKMEVICTAIKERLRKEELEEIYYGIEFPLSYVLADMEMYGFRVDTQILQHIGVELNDRLQVLTREIYELGEQEFNINSPKQLGEILFVKLQLPAIKKTKTGYSTDNEVLEDLKDKHEIIEKIMEYRRLIKLKGTYVDGLIPLVKPETGRIHSHLNQIVAATGRLSSTDPNLQNIPVKTKEGREIRKAFVAEGEERMLVVADYSQIELRILAHIAGDESLIRAFQGEEDIHTHTASEVFGIPESEVTKTQRSRAKAVNFGIVYGISDFGLSRDIGVSRKEAKAYIDTYLERYPGVKRYMEDIVTFAKTTGYVTTLLGRKRFIPEISSRNAAQRGFGERVAMNTPIQGSAADIIKKAMLDVYRELKEKRLASTMIMQVHDELIIEAPISEVDQVRELLKRSMENTIRLRVPITADVNVGRNWFESK